MNARTFIQSTRVLIVASGLVAASTVFASAQDVPIALGTQATIPLSSYYIAPPSGQATLGGHAFDLTAGNLIQLGNGQSVTYTGSYANATNLYLLINTFNTSTLFDQSPVGTVVVTFSDGTSVTTTLTVGQNVAEWRTGSGVTVNTLQASSAPPVVPGSWTTTAAVWSGSAQPSMGGGTAVINLLTILLSAAPGKTVTSIALNDTNGFGALKIDLAGLTVGAASPTPTPTPTPGGCGQKSAHGKFQTERHTPWCYRDGDRETDHENGQHEAGDRGNDD